MSIKNVALVDDSLVVNDRRTCSTDGIIPPEI